MPPIANIISGGTIAAGVFSGTISIGTAVVATLVIAVAGYFASRYKLTELAQEQTKGAQEAASEWRDNYLAERQRADDFEKRYQEQRALKHEALANLAAEKLKTDQTVVIRALETQMRALRTFHDDFVQRETEAAEIRTTVLATEERIVEQLAVLARALEELEHTRQNGGTTA
jgi:hypothetical protein